jgi:hypothetical protein
MQLSPPTPQRAPRRLVHQDGFSMFLVIMVMFVSAMFVAAGFAAANGDLPLSGNWRDRKTAYAAAEAGLNFYQYHLDQDNDYWLKCTNVKAPNATEPSPVNDAWDGVATRQWRNVPGSQARYTIELLPAPGKTKCVENDQESMIDPRTGTFRIRVTGQARAGSPVKRSIVASLRRRGFLDFLWFTHFETTDPKNYPPGTSSGQATWAATNCPFMRGSRNSGCTEIQFITDDWMHGPMHTDDTYYICGKPKFGRDANDDPDAIDTIEASGTNPAQGWLAGGCTAPNQPDVQKGQTVKAGVPQITLPTTNSSLKSIAKGAYSLMGKTTIVLTGDRMKVTNAAAGLTNADMAMPDNGVVYVDNDSDPSKPCSSVAPRDTQYTDSVGCGNLYVGGHSSVSLTLAAKNDIIVTRTQNAGNNPDGTRKTGLFGDDDSVMLGLVADNFVRVEHRVDGSHNNSDTPVNFEIDAAILALSHSFTVDNYQYGVPLGDLIVDGAIAQRFRGAVGTNNNGTVNHGYAKDYHYDERLKYQTPPYFLQPLAASWHVMRRNEQVPAT